MNIPSPYAAATFAYREANDTLLEAVRKGDSEEIAQAVCDFVVAERHLASLAD